MRILPKNSASQFSRQEAFHDLRPASFTPLRFQWLRPRAFLPMHDSRPRREPWPIISGGHELRAKARDLVVGTPGAAATWIGDSEHFWYPKTVRGGTEFVLVDADAGVKKAAFDQDRLAAAISSVSGHTYTALRLPFAPQEGRGGAGRPMPEPGSTAPLIFADGEQSIQFGMEGLLYKCSLSDYTCVPRRGQSSRGARRTRGGAGR